MLIDDIDQIETRLPDFDALTAYRFGNYKNKLVVNDKIALPLIKVSQIYDYDNPIIIKDESNQVLGQLYILKGKAINLSSMPEDHYIIYFTEIELKNLGLPYLFKFNYLIIEKGKYDLYITKYFKTSSLWGKFIHKENLDDQRLIPSDLSTDAIITIFFNNHI